MSEDAILAAIARVRQRTLGLYQRMAALTDAAALGWTVREPGHPDLTLRLITHALRDAPHATRLLLEQIADHDEEIVFLTRQLAAEEPPYGTR